MNIRARYRGGHIVAVQLHHAYKWRDVTEAIELALEQQAAQLEIVDVNDRRRFVRLGNLAALALDSGTTV